MNLLEIVEEHVRCENAHDLQGLMSTFGSEAIYEDEPWSERHVGHAAVREYYRSLLEALPDLRIAVQRRHPTSNTVILEVVISGTHLGAWRGLPPTGRRVEFPLCGILTFGSDAKLAGERIYYDRAGVLQQVGVFHDPTTLTGRIVTPLSHPVTMARALVDERVRTAKAASRVKRRRRVRVHAWHSCLRAEPRSPDEMRSRSTRHVECKARGRESQTTTLAHSAPAGVFMPRERRFARKR